jgi:hypothetical protein
MHVLMMLEVLEIEKEQFRSKMDLNGPLGPFSLVGTSRLLETPMTA